MFDATRLQRDMFRATIAAAFAAFACLAEAQLTRSVDFLSVAGYDGHIQARIDGSNPKLVVGTSNGKSIRIGDEETNGVPDEAYRGFLSFDTSGIPENATITAASLFLTQGGSGGGDNLDVLGDPILEIKRGFFGLRRTIQPDDFLAPPDYSPAPLNVSPSIDRTETVLSQAALAFINKGASIAGGVTQFRLRYTNFTNNNGNRDFLGFFSGVVNDPPDAARLHVTFTVPAVDLLALPAALVFPPQASAAGPSAAQTITIENTGGAVIALNSVTVIGSNAADFLIFSDTGQAGLAPGQKRLIDIVFDPSGTVSARSATLRISTGSAAQPVVDVPLTGEVAGVGIAVDPSVVQFDPVRIPPDMAPVRTVVISSSSTAPLTITSVTLGGADAGQFSIVSDTGEAALSPGFTRTLQISFTPQLPSGAKEAVLHIVSNAGNFPDLSIPISGAGFVCRETGDFDCSGCTDLGDFLFLLDNWLLDFEGRQVGLDDFLAMLDNWQAGYSCP